MLLNDFEPDQYNTRLMYQANIRVSVIIGYQPKNKKSEKRPIFSHAQLVKKMVGDFLWSFLLFQSLKMKPLAKSDRGGKINKGESSEVKAYLFSILVDAHLLVKSQLVHQYSK